ncbi:alpha/beta hydrolase-fold protein [Aeromonas veronii]|uniref:alpha/beta hydrolase-fold protein n=1 Tax=Aeromonas veronii TaxID=654 RepID=UPI003D003362
MLDKKRLIYKGQHIALYIDDVSTSDVIFTFSGHGANPKDLYGDGFIQSLGFSGVFFVALANHWWQTNELNEAINIANTNTKSHTNRIVYGQSMGGYGALLCAARLKSRVVVTAPQTTLDEQNAKIPQSWMKDINQYPIIRDNIVSELIDVESIKIIYDIKDKWDFSHVNYLQAHINWIDTYTIPYATHNLPKTLREMGIISSVIASAFKEENDNLSLIHI